MSPKKKTEGMKQIKLDFTAAKRTGSASGAGAGGKAKVKVLGMTPPVLAPAVALAKPAPTPESPAYATRAKAQSARQVKAKAKAKVLDDEDSDAIETAEDVGVSDSESLSSVSTFETVESVKKPTPAPATPGRTTRSSAAAAAAASAKKDAVGPTTPTSTPKGKTSAKSPAKEKAKAKVKQEDLEEDAILEAEEDPESSKPTTIFKQSNATDAAIAKRVEANMNVTNSKAQDPTELRVKAVKWRKYHDSLKAKYGNLPTIHGENENKIHQILRYFDNIYEYGPCVGVTRRERWDRAQALGLNPPKEINDILNTIEGRTKDEYVQSVFYGQV